MYASIYFNFFYSSAQIPVPLPYLVDPDYEQVEHAWIIPSIYRFRASSTFHCKLQYKEIWTCRPLWSDYLPFLMAPL